MYKSFLSIFNYFDSSDSNFLFRWFAPLLEISRCFCFIFAKSTLLKVTETEFKEFNLELNVVSHVLQMLFIWSAVLWAIVFAYRLLDAKLQITSNLDEKLSKLQKKLIKGLQIRMNETEFKKVN